MKKIVLIVLVAVLAIGALAMAVAASGPSRNGQATDGRPAWTAGQGAYGAGARGGGRSAGGMRGTGNISAGLPAAEAPLSEDEVEALTLALDEEYKALATYESILNTFGNARPFANIARAEEQHITALVTLFERYDLEVPENLWAGKVPTFASLSEAAEAGVQAEVEDAALYDRLFSMVDNQDITQVFTALRRASLEQHLPAFEQYLAR